MIISYKFPGDTNEVLKWIQHDLYMDILLKLVQIPRRRYLRAARLVNARDDLTVALETLQSFDHRVLQATHDAIAAYYRFAHDRRGQMPLPLDDTPYTDLLEHNWWAFFVDEVARLTENDAFVRAVLTAVIHANTPAGYDAEDALSDILAGEYNFTQIPNWLKESADET